MPKFRKKIEAAMESKGIIQDGMPSSERPLFADGFDSAIVMMMPSGRLIYDEARVINILSMNFKEMQPDETSDEEIHNMAVEYYEFNIASAYVGEMTPIFAKKIWDVIDE